MALNDLISRAKKSKLGQSIQRVVSSADRDKDMPGFQIVRGGVSGGVDRVNTALSGGQNDFQPFANVVPATQIALSPRRYMQGQAPGQFAQDASYALRGATQLTPFQWGNMAGITPGSANYKASAPTTDRQKQAQSVGRSIYGLGLTAPIGGASKAVNVARNAAVPTVAGGAINTAFTGAGTLLSERRTPTGQELGQYFKTGAFQGFKQAPVLAVTNPITNRVLSNLGGSFLSNQAAQRTVGGFANVIEDELISKLDNLTPTSKERILSFLLGAVMTGNDELVKGLKGDLQTQGLTPKQADEAVKTVERLRDQRGRFTTDVQDTRIPTAGGGFLGESTELRPRPDGTGLERVPLARSRLGSQGGFIDFNAKIGGGSDLFEEARKYKSAEEFIQEYNKKTGLHGGPKELEGGILKTGMKHGGKSDSGGIFLAEPTETGKLYARSYTLDKPDGGAIHRFEISDKAKIFDLRNPEHLDVLKKNVSADELNYYLQSSRNGVMDWATMDEELLQDLGFDGVKLFERPKGFKMFDESGKLVPAPEDSLSIALWDNKHIKPALTKQQLTDIYNQAKQTTTNIFGQEVPLPPKGQSGFVDFNAEVGSGLFKTTEDGYKLINESGGKIDAERLYLLKQEADLYPNSKEFIKRFNDGDLSEKQLLEIYKQAKGIGQPKPQLDTPENIIKPEKLESSKRAAQRIIEQKRKAQTFQGEQPVQGGSRLRVKPSGEVSGVPSKVSSKVSISRDGKYAFNINKKKLGLNTQQSKQLDDVVETMRPVLEGNKGKTLTKKEIIEGGRKAKVLEDVIGREESKAFAESLQASRNFLKSEQAQVGITPKYLEQLEIVTSNAANAGRMLQSFNIGAEDIPIKEKVLRDIIKIGADAKEVLDAGNKVDWNDAKQITDFYRKFKPATLADKLDEYRYTNMLSSPNTHINNAFSNFLQTAVLAPIEKSVRGGVSFAEAKLTGKEQEYFARQGVDYAKGYWKALPEATENFFKTLKGIDGLKKPDVDFIPTSTSKARQIYTLPLQALEASDQFFRTLVKGGEMESLKAEGITGAKATKMAEQAADYRTFRQAFDPEGKLGQNKVLQVWDKWNSAVNNLRNVPGGKYLVPFLQTPTNILKQGVEYSPLGFATVKGSARPAEQLSKAIIGTGVFTGAYALAESGLTTWDTPTNATERAEFYAAGLQPYSIKIGDKWVSYSKLGPLAYPIAMASALKWAKDNGASEDQLATIGNAMAGTLGFFADQSYVRGIGDIIDAFRGDEYKQARGLSNIPAQLIPYRSAMGWIARLVDPVYRKTTGGTVPEQIGKSLVSQIPFASKSLEAYQTPFGTDSERQFPMVNAISPFSISQERPEEKAYYDARNSIRQEKKEVNRILDKIEAGEDVKIDSNKLATKQAVDLTKKKIEAGLEVTDKELETAYLNKELTMPSSNRYEKGQRDSKLWSKTGDIMDDENLSDAQKSVLLDKISTELGVGAEDIEKYQIAKQDNNSKTLHTLDQIDKMQSNEELLNYLVKGRKPINGKILISDGVIDNLVDDGLIPYQLGKDLKKLDFNADGTTKKTSSRSGSKSKKDPYNTALKKYLDNLSKISLSSGSSSKIRTQAPVKINTKGLTFEG